MSVKEVGMDVEIPLDPYKSLSIIFIQCGSPSIQKRHFLNEICSRGNNKVVISYFLIRDKGLLFMLELY